MCIKIFQNIYDEMSSSLSFLLIKWHTCLGKNPLEKNCDAFMKLYPCNYRLASSGNKYYLIKTMPYASLDKLSL